MAGLKEILKVSHEGSLLNAWHLNAISALESFLYRSNNQNNSMNKAVNNNALFFN